MQSYLDFGLLMGVIWSTWTISNTSSADICKCNITLCEQRCNVSEDVHGLSCFGKRITDVIKHYNCVWNPGKYDTYSLYIKQRRCQPIYSTNETLSSKLKPFSLVWDTNLTAVASAVSSDNKRCTFAKFSGQSSKIIQCGPPSPVSFKRSYGHLNVTAEWDDWNVKQYHLKYREHNSTVWKEVKSQNSRDCTVGNLVTSQSYEMQIWCVVTTECPQCPLSDIISIPPELTDAPVITETRYDLAETGLRKITVKWEYVHSHAVEAYNVTVQKASGEPARESSYLLKVQSVTLFLCYSAYKLSISALNKAGLSPAARLDVDAMEDQSDLDKDFNVTLISNNSFGLSWNNMWTKKYHCYSVEWWANDEELAYKPFYGMENYHTIQTQNVAFQPYKRYHFFLHARHEKDTCNLKYVNNSDQTFGRTQVYLSEGTPLTAPGNISSSKVTQNSFVITWSPVREEELRGFLQGYIIRYTQDSSNKDITVKPSMNSYQLLNLRSGSIYCVELSAFTAAGEGKRSESKCFDTLDSVPVGGMLVGVIAGVLVLLLATHLCFRLLKRSKKMLWPSIPNPCNSNAVQKIEGGQDLEVMELLSRPHLEETEEHVFVLEAKKETPSTCCVSQDWTKVTLMPNTAPLPEGNEPISSSTASTTPKDASPMESNHLDSIEDPPVGAKDIKDAPSILGTPSVSTAVANPTSAFMSDYTTMELFQQITNGMPPAPSGSGAAAQNYLRQSLSLSQRVGTAPDPTYLTESICL
ncbi:oncostatin-M-specific receptor subunit beta isoform X2 [Hemibagrus wyckioides]|uniref:oncostatin-M-specific receptor subunit beta isoform X2 n=1 Tax=Hemibagrus wyckioides TaxID=337641 RepID=UPI00266DBA2D|nr:oncostatin-M-specific receptor subunit beta isoform X2 [Hemibagrus wyckioides]